MEAAGAEKSWRSGLAGIARLARLLVVPSCAAMLLTKLAAIWAVSQTASGAAQVGAELGLTSLASWAAPDLGAGILWAAFASVLLGWSFTRFSPWRLAGLIATGLALALFLTVSIEVVRLYALQPQRALLAALSRPTEASDSIAALIGARVVANFAVLSAALIGGPLLLARAARRLEARALHLGGALAAVVVTVFVAANFAEPSLLELDRNPVLRMAGSYLEDDALQLPAPVATGSFDGVLAPLVGEQQPTADLAAYKQLKEWAERERPNLVLVILESTAPAHMGAFGASVDNTPTLSALLAKSIRWPHHFAHTPSSMFAIYSLLASNHGTPFGQSISISRPRIAADSLSERLTSAGYHAGLFHSSHFTFFDKDQFLAGRGYEVMIDAQSVPNRSSYIEGSWGIEEKATIDAIVGWAKEAADGDAPLFVTYIPFAPHHPYNVPRSEFKKTFGAGQVGRYRGALYYMDAMLGDLIARFEALELPRKTLYVVVADHGEGFGEHPGSFMHGLNLFQEGVRSFVAFYAPTMPLDYTEPRNTGHVDLAPTLLDLLGFSPSPAHVGKSALAPGPRQMIPLYSGKTARKNVGFVDGHLKFLIDLGSSRSQLFDLASDPTEKTNLAAKQPRLVGLFRERALQFVSEQKSWEAALKDVDDSRYAVDASRATTMTLDARSCAIKPPFAVEGKRITVTAAGTRSLVCEMAIRGPGTVTSFAAIGREEVGGSLINASVLWRAASGEGRSLARCMLNGNEKEPATECRNRPAPGLGGFDRGGIFEVELRFIAGGAGLGGERFGIDRVEIDYVSAD